MHPAKKLGTKGGEEEEEEEEEDASAVVKMGGREVGKASPKKDSHVENPGDPFNTTSPE